MSVEEKMQLVKTSLYEQVADYLEDQILNDASIKEDDKLPSEQALAEQFGVSRNVIRESLKLLKERGLIDPRNGTGSYITKPEASNVSDILNRIVLMDNVTYPDIYEMRIILESAASRKAAVLATEEQLEEMEGYLEKLNDRSIPTDERREYDFAFHIAIAKAAGNPLLEILINAMKNLFLSMIEKGIFVTGGIDDAIKRHASIMKALRDRDPDRAEEMIKEHLLFSQKNVENYYKNHTPE